MDQNRSRLREQYAVVLGIAVSIAGVLVLGRFEMAAAADPGEKIVKSVCVQCHRIEGKPAPRRTKKAPDLIWAGNKYQRAWLVAWLQNRSLNITPSAMTFARSGRSGIWPCPPIRRRL